LRISAPGRTWVFEPKGGKRKQLGKARGFRRCADFCTATRELRGEKRRTKKMGCKIRGGIQTNGGVMEGIQKEDKENRDECPKMQREQSGS